MHIDPGSYAEIPENRHRISAGSVLLPTQIPIVAGGATSLEFVLEQGGNEDTFIFMFGVRQVYNLLGIQHDILEGVFLSETGPGFLPTWGYEQLMHETDLGGWRVVPTEEVLSDWAQRVEARMNLG